MTQNTRGDPPRSSVEDVVERLLEIAHHFESRGYAHGKHLHHARAARQAAGALTALKSERDEARAWRARFDTCMCGSPMESHSWSDNHSPVSEYDYRLDQAEKRAEAAEASLRAFLKACGMEDEA